jgi:hypothetical protein
MIASKMRPMRNLNQGPRLAGSTLSEIKRAYEVARVRVGGRVKASGAAKPGEFLSAVLIHFLDLDDAAKLEVIEYGMGRLEGMKRAQDDGGDWVRPEGKAPAGGAGGVPSPKLAVDQKKPNGKPRPKKQSGNGPR